MTPVAPAPFPSYRERYLPALTRRQIEALPDKRSGVVLISTASVEQHGPHLPVGVDAILGQAGLPAALPLLPAALNAVGCTVMTFFGCVSFTVISALPA